MKTLALAKTVFIGGAPATIFIPFWLEISFAIKLQFAPLHALFSCPLLLCLIIECEETSYCKCHEELSKEGRARHESDALAAFFRHPVVLYVISLKFLLCLSESLEDHAVPCDHSTCQPRRRCSYVLCLLKSQVAAMPEPSSINFQVQSGFGLRAFVE